MTSKELRKKFLEFFKKNGHEIVPSSSLIPPDPSVLLTTAGMQQFKPYYLGTPSPYGKNVSSCQKCFRTSDIEEVGDERHLTFLEMLGNFSFGGYFKERAINLAYQFLFKELEFSLENAFFTVFEGDTNVPEDKESLDIWRKLGVPESKIKKFKREDNFWGPTGREGPCGPTTEIYLNNIEVWNIVFNEYYQDEKGRLTPLSPRGVDTGMGLERLTMVYQGKESVYETDLFWPIIKGMEREAGIQYDSTPRLFRIIADHSRASVFLAAEGILPSNIERGYILRRVLRRAMGSGRLLHLPKNFLISLSQIVIDMYGDVYPELKSNKTDILTIIQNEEEKFERAVSFGIKETSSELRKPDFDGKKAFYLYESYGIPLDLIEEVAREEGIKINKKNLQKEFREAFKKHQEVSRAGVEKKFGGLGKEAGYESTKLHTATHLLQAALRQIFGKHIKQMGSDITPQRLRFDFSHPKKLTSEELKRVEDLVNKKIKEDLKIVREEMNLDDALKSGALSFFKERYPQRVTVYIIKDSSGNVFSKEICAGPHVAHTGELGHFKIKKEESAGAGIRRIRAVILPD